MPIRKAAEVIQQLLDEMDATVRNYDPTVGRTCREVDDLIQGKCHPNVEETDRAFGNSATF
jgi:hypothetical protein